MSIASEQLAAPVLSAAHAVYEIIDRFTVAQQGEGSATRRLDVWAPLIPDAPDQQVLDIAVVAPSPWQVTREVEFGNQLLYGHYDASAGGLLEFEVRYLVERMTPRQNRATLGAQARALATPALFTRSLDAERHVDVSDETRQLARQIADGETSPLEQARRYYDYVTGTMEYDASKQSWLGSTQHALTCSVGNCNDIHALFVSLCRSSGIPARFVLGQALEPSEDGEPCDLCGYHCWAQFFVAGLGWLPADASCAVKYDTHGLFGALETNHIAWSVGRDLLLAPPQRGERNLFLAGPYAEADGQPHRVERTVNFTQVE
ncbi:MAG TPA: transglutaminase family protein [Actinocrinis sp.]|uniref:transglutaminase-like domain-containing protein n=1 Tax=Actinocrinis sp. TaxID=1920516 RepID=UPI002DDDB8FB|nr:transglutaminase family protein [Actinocrinis sp.]HEV2344391.1 transglutaminase family protein [Actinocrinis sp.]